MVAILAAAGLFLLYLVRLCRRNGIALIKVEDKALSS